jgi:hypothetical protein
MIVSAGAGLERNSPKRDLHHHRPARSGALFAQGEHGGSALAHATEVARP